MSFELFAVICLILLAVGGLITGVANDAVNFTNAAIGAKVSSTKVIMIIASIGMIMGATFSDGIIEVARKGIFYPQFFSLTGALIIFTAAGFTQVILLDIYSTFGLPTSTTVSVIFALLGSAFALGFLKLGSIDAASSVINSASVIPIIIGILLSIVVALVAGMGVQFITRLIFTFDYVSKFNKYGFLWSGVALTSLLFFILIKGGQHASFISAESKMWINSHVVVILGLTFAALTALSYILIKMRINVLKVIILIGTASLAMAFAGNDLANFIGVSVSGMEAFLGSDLSQAIVTPVWVLLISGVIMSVTICFSAKGRTVTNTEVNLASHEKHVKNHWKARALMFLRRNLWRWWYSFLMS